MSEYSDKVLAGLPTTNEEWREHLLAAHRAAPGMTGEAFEVCRTVDGQNSYELLARELETAGVGGTAVDLACGEGTLFKYLSKISRITKIVGIDMSEDELALARSKNCAKNVEFLCERAEKLSLPNESVDAIVCHMALMLMSPLDEIAVEIRRVLKPGGIFAAALFAPAAAREPMPSIRALIMDFIHKEFPQFRAGPMGDPRSHSPDALSALFTDAGFARVEKNVTVDLFYRSQPAGLWKFWRDTYFVGMLPAARQEALAKLLGEFAEKLAKNLQGEVEVAVPVRIFVARA